jgi:hypothetical protein
LQEFRSWGRTEARALEAGVGAQSDAWTRRIVRKRLPLLSVGTVNFESSTSGIHDRILQLLNSCSISSRNRRFQNLLLTTCHQCYQCYQSVWHSYSSENLKRKWFGHFGKEQPKKVPLSKRLTAACFEASCCPGNRTRVSKKHSLKCRTMETTPFSNGLEGNLEK